MPDIPILDDDHVLRWASFTKLIRDPETNEVTGVAPIAFRLKAEKGETYLSCAHVEHYGGDHASMVSAAAKGMQVAQPEMIKRTGAFAVGRVGAVKQVARTHNGSVVLVLKAPKWTNPAYAKVSGIEAADTLLHEILAASAWGTFVKADDVLP